ncbi:MAG TPA: YiiD C-terminal domain-containing protein, partial [Rhodanobacteraceae bacterium]|nr:YiiD C-terminal domain-containing protein [Rhodanobacteraceae bacterium]
MDANETAAADLEAEILERIPLARAMQLGLSRYTGSEIEMTAPLAPNINDKGCAFGGSMASLLTLAGWGLVVLNLRSRGIDCDIYVGDSRLRYHEPVWGGLRGVAHFTDAGGLDGLLAGLAERGKGRADVICEIAGTDGPAATLEARFVAKL